MEQNFSSEDCVSGKQSSTNSWGKDWQLLNRLIELTILHIPLSQRFCGNLTTAWEQSHVQLHFSGLAFRLFRWWSCCPTALRWFPCTIPSGDSSKMPLGFWILSWCVRLRIHSMHHWLMLCFLKLFGRTHLEYAALLFVNYVRFIPLIKWGKPSV